MATPPRVAPDEAAPASQGPIKRNPGPRSAILRHLDDVTNEIGELRSAREAGPLADPDAISKGQETGRALDAYTRSPLHMAAAAGDTPFLRSLLRNPALAALVGARDSLGLTPCHHAATVGRQVALRLRACGPVLDLADQQELIGEVAWFLAGLPEEGSDAHDALVASRKEAGASKPTDADGWGRAGPPLWCELEEEAEAGLIPGVWVEVCGGMMPGPPVAERRPQPADAALPPPSGPPSPGKSKRASVTDAPPLPPAEPSAVTTSLSGVAALDLAVLASEKIPTLEVRLRHCADATAEARMKDPARRLVVGVGLADAMAALKHVVEMPPARVGSLRVPPELWSGALGRMAAPARLSLHNLRLTNAAVAAVGPRALWVQAELLGEEDEPALARALLRRPLADAVPLPLPSPKQRRRRSSVPETAPAARLPPVDPPSLELRLPAAVRLDALNVRLSLWTEDGAAHNKGTDRGSIPAGGPFPPGWRELGGVRVLVEAAQTAHGGFGRLVLSTGTEASAAPGEPAKEGGEAPPAFELDWALVGEGQVIQARRSRMAAAAGPTVRVGVPVATADGPACLAELIAAGAPVDAGDLLGATPLHKAAAHDHVCAVALLLRAGANVDAADAHGERSLHRAADNGKVAAGALLLRRGAQIDAANGAGEGALHRACARGEAGFASMLLQAGASVVLADERGWAPVHTAVDAGHAPSLAALVSYCRARRLPCCLLETTGGEGPAYPAHDSALHIGLRACRLPTLKWLLDHEFGSASLVANADGHTAAEVLAALLPKLDKVGMKQAGKGAKSLLPPPAEKKKGKEKKKPPKNLLHRLTAEGGFARLGADGVKGMLELQKVLAREEKAAAALATAKAKQDAADAKKIAEAEAKKAKGGKK
jgi:ankyrin repeat protein